MHEHTAGPHGHAFDRRRFLALGAAGAVAAWGLPAARTLAVPDDAGSPPGEWLAGDLHVHTTYSHDVWSGPGDDNTGPEELYTLGWTPAQQIALAEARGLDFVALTDHNRTDALRDPGYRSSRLVLVPGYEHSLSGGHAGVFVPDARLVADIVRDARRGTGFETDDGLRRFLAGVHERGGVAVLNHPSGDSPWKRAIAPTLGFDAIEVWNGRWQQRHDVLPPAYTDNHVAVPWWERELLARGRRIGVTGGSDNHWVTVTAAAGVGQPTTWVHAAARTPAAVIDAVRAGRTTIAHEPPLHAGPRVTLDVVELDRGRRRVGIGGTVAPHRRLEVTVRVTNGVAQQLRLIGTGRVVGAWPVLALDESRTTTVVLPPRGWLRGELSIEPGYAMTALTGPVWAADDDRAPGRRHAPTSGSPVTY